MGLNIDYYDDKEKRIFYDAVNGNHEFKIYEDGNIEIQKPDNIAYVKIDLTVPFVNYRGEASLTRLIYYLYLGKKIYEGEISQNGFANLGDGNIVYIPNELKQKSENFALTKCGLFCLRENDAIFPSKERLFESVYNIIKTVYSQYSQTFSNIEETNLPFSKRQIFI